MRVNGYQCDACCTVKSGENSLKDWFAVYDFRKGVESDEQHFCSLHCLHEWVEKQIPVVGQVFPSFRNSKTEEEKQEDREYWRDN